MAKFRDIPRGWATEVGVVVNTALAVDNEVNAWEEIPPNGNALIQAQEGEQLMTGENTPDFWLERVVVHFAPFAVPTALNFSGFIDAFITLAVFATNVAQLDDVPPQMSSNPLWADLARQNVEYVRMLRTMPLRVTPRQLPKDGEGSTSWVNPASWQMFDVKNLFLRRNESLVIGVSQTGDVDDFSPWLAGDEVQVPWMSQVLVRQKKGR